MSTKKKSAPKAMRVKCDPRNVESFDYSGLDECFSALSKPAQRALINNRILTPNALSKWTEAAIAGLHGIGPSTYPLLRKCLKAKGLSFKK